MYKKAWCTWRVVVLLILTNCFLTFSLPSPQWHLKLPNYYPYAKETRRLPDRTVMSSSHLGKSWLPFIRGKRVCLTLPPKREVPKLQLDDFIQATIQWKWCWGLEVIPTLCKMIQRPPVSQWSCRARQHPQGVRHLPLIFRQTAKKRSSRQRFLKVCGVWCMPLVFDPREQ